MVSSGTACPGRYAHPYYEIERFIALYSLIITLFPITFALAPVIVTHIDMNVTAGSTFSSHKHQVVENDNGVFMAYYWMNDPPPWKGYWNLVRSGDGCETFELRLTSPGVMRALRRD